MTRIEEKNTSRSLQQYSLRFRTSPLFVHAFSMGLQHTYKLTHYRLAIHMCNKNDQ